MTKVPLFVMIGKSPMNTVWLLISPVVLFMNSAVTNSGAAYVMSLSLHSSRDALTSSKRGLEKDSDIEPLKSSIGEISSRISARPPTASACSSGGRVLRHCGLPTSQSNEAVWRASRSGTSRGSWILANETRSGAPGIFCWSAPPVRGPDCGSTGVVRVVPDSVVPGVMLLGREPAKMRPSKDLTTCGRWGQFVLGRRRYRRGGPRTPAPSEESTKSCSKPFPGTPGDPSQRAGSQRAAQQETLPLLCAGVHAGPPQRPGDPPRGWPTLVRHRLGRAAPGGTAGPRGRAERGDAPGGDGRDRGPRGQASRRSVG